jgi:hypothetical protein
MRGSDVSWPADVAADAANRTGGSRLLLDELLAERERAANPAPSSPPPVLTVDPVAVPPSLDNSRKATRQRLVELENAAMRNYHSAEEARRALVDEHNKLEQELAARAHAQREAAILRRELERISSDEARRAEVEKKNAKEEARAAVAKEVKRYQEEQQHLLDEMNLLRNSKNDDDGLLEEYVSRLREEQGARALLRAELERAEAARSLAERSLQRATENARQTAEDETMRATALEQELADMRSDRDRLAATLADLTSGDGAMTKLTAQLEAKDTEIAELAERVSGLDAAVEAAEAAAREAIAERDAAFEARNAAEAMQREADKARAEADVAADVAAARVDDLENELSERGVTDDERSREIDETLGKLRREAREASNARDEAQEARLTAEAEREELRARVADLEAEVVRACAEGDRLRALAATSGDGLAGARATVTELQAAAPAHLPAEEPAGEEEAALPAPAAEIRREDSSEESPTRGGKSSADNQGAEPAAAAVKPPLPSRVAGRRAPVTEPVRRRPKRDPALAGAAAATSPVRGSDQPMAPAWVAAIQVEPRPAAAAAIADAPAAAVSEPAPEPPAAEAEPPARPAPVEESLRRTAFAEFTSLASTSDKKPSRSR